MSLKPESSLNKENDGNKDIDSVGRGALYEESTESRFFFLASSNEFIMIVDDDYGSIFLS
jgi:hypothetical protein